jgi:hypothetical protein
LARYHGKSGVVYASATGTSDAVPVLSLNAWSLNLETDTVDVTAFGDPNKVYVQGLKDTSGDLSGFWDSAADTLFDAADSVDGTKLYLYPSSAAPTHYFYGPAWVNMSVETGVGDAVTASGSFVAAGAWSRKP